MVFSNRKISVGDPAERRACFSRFILPFRWQAQKVLATSAGGPAFRRASKHDWIYSAIENGQVVDDDRCRYFTPEIAELLYHRASWFVLDESKGTSGESVAWWKKSFKVRSGLENASHQYEVELRPPALILFEYSDAGDIFSNDARGGIFRTGFLVVEAFFPNPNQAPKFEDLLRFNEIFRFWRCPFKKHAEFCKNELRAIYDGMFGPGTSPNEGHCDPKLYADRWMGLFRHPIQDADGKLFYVMPQAWVDENNRQPNGDPHWLVHPDDRAFVMTCAFLDGHVDLSSGQTSTTNEVPWATAVGAAFAEVLPTTPPLAGHWVRLLNVDRPRWRNDNGSCSRFEYTWALERTYRRWAHDGCLYGFNLHSMALLAGPASDSDPHGEPPLALHCGSLYFDVTLLLLYLRVSLFRFSKRLHQISARTRAVPDASRHWETWAEDFGEIRWNFLQFENLYQFPLLSNQQQNVEMYTLQRAHMDIQELYDEIDKEVRSSDEVLNNKLDQNRNELAVLLNVVALVGVAAALALAWMDAHSPETLGVLCFLLLSLVFFICMWGVIFLSKPISRRMLWVSSRWPPWPPGQNRGASETPLRKRTSEE